MNCIHSSTGHATNELFSRFFNTWISTRDTQ